MTSPMIASLGGLSAWLAAAMTVVGMATLMAFFSRGGRWGTYNDAASVVLMLALIPVALVLAVIELEVVATTALVIAVVGVGSMLALAFLQALLVIGRVTYEQTRYSVLGIGAVVGVWYLLTSIATDHTVVPDGARAASAAAGLGFIAVGYGFARSGERHPAAVVGGIVLFVASLVFQLWIGWVLITGDLPIPDWNV